MPGTIWDVRCAVCGWQIECSTGASLCLSHPGLFGGYAQFGCAACGRITSAYSCDEPHEDPICSCGGAVTPWTGQAGFDGEPLQQWDAGRALREEIFAGACPRCGEAVQVAAYGLWD